MILLHVLVMCIIHTYYMYTCCALSTSQGNQENGGRMVCMEKSLPVTLFLYFV